MAKVVDPFGPSDVIWHINEASCSVTGVRSPFESISPAQVLTSIMHLRSQYLALKVFECSKLLRIWAGQTQVLVTRLRDEISAVCIPTRVRGVLLFLLQNVETIPRANQFPIQCLPGFFLRDKSGQGLTLIAHLLRVPKLNSGAIPLLPYVFMGWTDKFSK